MKILIECENAHEIVLPLLYEIYWLFNKENMDKNNSKIIWNVYVLSKARRFGNEKQCNCFVCSYQETFLEKKEFELSFEAGGI